MPPERLGFPPTAARNDKVSAALGSALRRYGSLARIDKERAGGRTRMLLFKLMDRTVGSIVFSLPIKIFSVQREAVSLLYTASLSTDSLPVRGRAGAERRGRGESAWQGFGARARCVTGRSHGRVRHCVRARAAADRSGAAGAHPARPLPNLTFGGGSGGRPRVSKLRTRVWMLNSRYDRPSTLLTPCRSLLKHPSNLLWCVVRCATLCYRSMSKHMHLVARLISAYLLVAMTAD
ncbi:hypothetical protein EVAR_21486_1 [Eumeta japonica]|uniref:Uncharacterized protein n=1 Tax=Eumeta variegata TaxID=151549 RepID=A0A4C1UYV5_EUMVA|nr:hypothetical protein EVAR_21486_1 [Eumeta japonica]